MISFVTCTASLMLSKQDGRELELSFRRLQARKHELLLVLFVIFLDEPPHDVCMAKEIRRFPAAGRVASS